MPKETIGNAERQGDDWRFHIAVQWDRHGSLQLASLRDIGPEGEPANEYPGWYVNFDRQSVNKLIRVLRRARDQAFGRDA